MAIYFLYEGASTPNHHGRAVARYALRHHASGIRQPSHGGEVHHPRSGKTLLSRPEGMLCRHLLCRDPRECYADPYYLGPGCVVEFGGRGDGHGATTVPAKNGVFNQGELARENENLGFPAKNKILNLHGAST